MTDDHGDDDNDWQPEDDKEVDYEASSREDRVQKEPVPQQQGSSKQPRSRNVFDARLMTENGGYSHTLDSKLKISKANRGNTPWNKVRAQSLCLRAHDLLLLFGTLKPP